MNYVLATLAFLALVTLFVLSWRQWSRAMGLLLQNNQEQSRGFLNLLQEMQTKSSLQQTELLNRLQSHNWQEFMLLQEQANPPLNTPDNLIVELDDEDEEVLTSLFDPELEDHWNKTHG